MTDTPTGSGHDPAEPTQPEHLDPPVTTTPPSTDLPPVSTVEVPTATPGEPATPLRRRGVTVPWWALAVVAALVVFAGGYLIGHAVGDDHGDRRSSARPVGPGGGFGRNEVPNPFGGNGNGPFGGNGGGGNSPAARSQAFLGVGVDNAANGGGARITTVVASGPAAGAGLAQGDVITAIGDTKVTNSTSLRSAIGNHEPGDGVKVTYTRDGAEKTADATLGDRNATSQ